MNPIRLRWFKTAALLAPLLVFLSLMKLYSDPVQSFFRDTFSPSHLTHKSSDHFIFVSDSRSRYHEDARYWLEQFGETVHRRYGLPPLPKESKITVYLVNTESQLLPFGHIAGKDDPTRNAGYCFPERREIAALISNHHNRDRAILQHEMTHLLLHILAPEADWSPWLEEGMALALQINPEQPVKSIKLPSFSHMPRADSADTATPDLRRLLNAAPEKYSDESRRLFYRDSHSLVVFLLEQHPDSFDRYFQAEQLPGTISQDTFEQHFGDLRKLEQEWIAFLKKRT